MRDIDVGKPNENVDLMFGKKHGKLYVNINLFKMATTFSYIMKQNNIFQKNTIICRVLYHSGSKYDCNRDSYI